MSKQKEEALLLRLQGSIRQLVVWLAMRTAIFIYGASLGVVVVLIVTASAVTPATPPPVAKTLFLLIFLYLFPMPFFLFLGDTTVTLVKLNERMRELAIGKENLKA